VIKAPVKCIHCGNENVVKMGKQPTTKTPRHKCNTCKKTFQTTYKNTGTTPQTKQQIIKMTTNGNSIRDTAHILNISTNTVTSVLKKHKTTKQT